ncbi:hypothetical protein OQI98_03785 [Legionella pneumophila]|uniref:hypothetical protein n=1 Tax=Legionella pneumophila TaxID=446 RepID=UPI001A2EA5C3|nr:hypothetical protein [Legionella pneumophila]MCW8388691.1 hypothetical protein [Legionella pneumophila]HAT1800141.1 hypothetical protein [Legionella pneumophila]HAT1802377.1 hypothetical protein [Legionella pneumophila]HCJ1067493.1 hypothetical protein [Legionella pneumophila]HCJ4411098.1 hypothetical protein [Legionella pneumophila]
MNNNYKNALLFVQISTHFREIFRVARLMKKRGAYSPKVFFVAPYEGWKQDFQQCQSEGIDCICYFNQPTLQNRDLNKKRNKLVRLLLFRNSNSESNKIRVLSILIQKNILYKLNKIKNSCSQFYKINANRIRKSTKNTLLFSLFLYRRSLKKIRLIHTTLIFLLIFLRSMFRKIIAVINVLFRGFYNAVQILLKGLYDSIYVLLEGAYNAVQVFLKGSYNSIYVLIASIYDAIKAILGNICNKVKELYRITLFLIKRLSKILYVSSTVIIRTIIQIGIKLTHKKPTSFFLLGFYKFIWNKKPQYLPPISKAAYYFYNYLPSLLLENHIELIILPEHNLFYFTQLLVYQGRKYQIPAIIVPFTIANTIEWSEAFYNEPSRTLKSIPNKIFARAFPHWVNHYKNRSLLLPVELILLHEMFGITPKNTWLLNSGDIDFLASESEAMKNYYISAGIEEKQIRVTGALYNDELFFRLQKAEDFRDELYEKLNMQLAKPMILCALPPNQCFGRMDLIEFGSYEEIIRFILSKLSQYDKDYNIIVNLHPRIVLNSVSYISDYPVKVYTGNIAEIIPLSSIFVASCSATIRMAISCGIPVVNYDLYHYNYDDYQNIKGVLTMSSKLEFSSILNKLTTESDFFEKIKTAQLCDSENWGVLDGKSGENLLHEIDLLFA